MIWFNGKNAKPRFYLALIILFIAGVIKFILWFGKYKWKNVHRDKWEIEFKKDEEAYERNIEQHKINKTEMYRMTLKLKNELIPELSKFSDNIYSFKYNYSYSLKDILKNEGLD